MDDSRLNKQIFLFDYSSNADTWCTDFHDFCIQLDLVDDSMNLRVINYDVFLDEIMESYAIENWKLTVESKPKLRTYRLFKVAPKARLRTQIFSKLTILVADALKTNSVNLFDRATTLKIDPFPYMAIMPYMERITAGDLYAQSEWH